MVSVVLVGVPVAFNLARAEGHAATFELFPRSVGPFPPNTTTGYYESLLNDPVLQEQLRLQVGESLAAVGDVTDVRPGRAEGAFEVGVAADTPGRALVFASAVAGQLANATRRQLDAEIVRELVVLRRRRARAVGAERRRLRARIAELTALGPVVPERIVTGPVRSRESERWPDRVSDALPGGFRPRDDPLRAGLAGLLVAATLCLAAFLMPPRRSPK